MKGKKCQQITQRKTGDLCQNNTHAEFKIEKLQSLKKNKKTKEFTINRVIFVLFTPKKSQKRKN